MKNMRKKCRKGYSLKSNSEEMYFFVTSTVIHDLSIFTQLPEICLSIFNTAQVVIKQCINEKKSGLLAKAIL